MDQVARVIYSSEIVLERYECSTPEAAIPILNEEERDHLVGLLVNLVSGVGDPRGYLALQLPLQLRGRFISVGSPFVLSQDAIDLCLSSGYDFNPPALDGILNALSAVNADVARYRARLDNPPPAAMHPLEAMVLSNRLPFADRGPLRAILQDMSVAQSPRPILAIGGDTESGRSHTAELISHYCTAQPDTVFCKYAMTPTNAAESGPKEVAVDIVIQLGGTTDTPLQTSNKEAWHKELANWVIAHANRPENRRTWVVLDGFERDILREDTFLFLVELQRLFTLGVAAKRHRLVFCSYPEELIAKVGASAKRYVTEPLTEEHIAALVKMIVEQSAIPEDERATMNEKTLKAILKDQTPPLKSLTVVGERLRNAIEQAGL